MKNTVTIILVTALVVFSAYYTVKKVRDNAGFMVPAVDMETPVKEAGQQAVKQRAVKVEKRAAALVEDMTEKSAGNAGHVVEAQTAAEETIEGSAGDVQPDEKILPAPEEIPAAASEKTGLIAEDIVMEEDEKDTLMSEIQEIIAAAEEAAVGTEEKITGPFTERAVEEVMPAAVEKPSVKTGEMLETLLAEEETGEPAKEALPAAEVENNVDVLQAEGMTKKPVEEALPVVAEESDGQVEERIEIPRVEGIKEEPVEDILPVVETGKIIETLLEDEIMKEPVQTPLTGTEAEPAGQVEERIDVSSGESINEEPAEAVLPGAEETPASVEEAGNITVEPVEEVMPADVEDQAVEVEEKIEALPVESATEETVEAVLPGAEETPASVEEAGNITAEPVEQVMPADEGPSMRVEEKNGPLLMKDETGDAFAEAEKRIAVLSFDNFSDDLNALKKIMPGLKKRLEEKGLTVVDEDSLSAFLCDEKIRSSTYISNEMLRKVRDKFSVRTILAGSVVSFSSKDNPQVGLLARSIDASTGVILWADYVSLSGDDFATVLGLGRVKKIDELIARALDRLFDSFSTVPARIGTESVYRIAVMPFQNKSRFGNAGIITMHMFLVELLKNEKFEPVEYGEVRKLIVDLRVRSKGELEYKNLEALSEALNIGGVLVGTVEQYSSGTDEASPPKVSINARLLDGRNNRILWYNSQESNGEKKIIAFEWGGKRPVDKVANGVVSELVERMDAARLHY